ncbi:MAG TPA: hypothetical protein VEK11_05750 [Thermoanaerobaculia bacterium]|nr:hypothetical protein [Thermoanaerobaculia bacterium]
MRLKSAFAVLLISVAATSPSLTGQEDAPLPPVTPRLTFEEAPAVVLAVEPIRESHQPTLVEAARFNDFVSFDALYRDAKARGESLASFAALHELWSWSMSDPLGAFYGREMYERLAAAYPGYARYIDDYRIVDSRGNVFWPTGETRAFLLNRALEGTAPRTLLASSGAPASAPVDAVASRRRATPAPVAEASVAPARVAARNAATSAGENVVIPQASAKQGVTNRVAQPAVETQTVVETQTAEAPSVETPQPVLAEAITPVVVPEAAPRDFASRGILLLVIGLIGVGLLAVMLRGVPSEPVATLKPGATVEPITKKQTPAPTQQPEAPRATGSHG